jgi:hypothetical protein
MAVTVADYSRDSLREFASYEAAQEWLKIERDATIFSRRSDGVIECWSPDSSRPVARILPEGPE